MAIPPEALKSPDALMKHLKSVAMSTREARALHLEVPASIVESVVEGVIRAVAGEYAEFMESVSTRLADIEDQIKEHQKTHGEE